MKKTRILRLFFNRADGFDGGEYLPGAIHQAGRDFDDYSQLFDNVEINKLNMTITTDKAEIIYIGDVYNNPEQLQGIMADIVQIYDNFIDEEMMGSVIYPIVEGDNTRIKFLR